MNISSLLTPRVLFFSGFIVHLAYSCIVLFTPGSMLYGGAEPDTGQLTDLLSRYTDNSREYIEPADNFLRNGVFGYGSQPDYRRTIGYPAIIAFFKILSGSYWYSALVLFQCFLGALIYPISVFFGKLHIKRSPWLLLVGVLFLMLSGTGFTAAPCVMSDLPFTAIFLSGLYFAIKGVLKKRWDYHLVSVFLITCSGLIRPTLMLYAPVHALVLLAFAMKHSDHLSRRMKWQVIGSSLLLVIGCNSSSFRTYHAYGTFSPSEILSLNMFDHTVKNILDDHNLHGLYSAYSDTAEHADNFIDRSNIYQCYFLKTVNDYPLEAVRYWTECAANHLLTPHWMNIGQVFGYYKREEPSQDLRESVLMKYIFYSFSVFNLLFIVIPFSLALLEMLRGKDRMIALALICYCTMFIGPTLLAGGSGRFRMPIEAFMIFPALLWISDRVSVLKLKKDHRWWPFSFIE